MKSVKLVTIKDSPITLSVYGVAILLFLAGCSPAPDDCDRNTDKDCERSGGGGTYIPQSSYVPPVNSTKPKSGFFSSLGWWWDIHTTV
jgi:hypothetical protein